MTGGRFPLLTMAALMSHCRLLVANDSGPLHLGLALGVPNIGLLGADDPRRVGPYKVDWGIALHKREEVSAPATLSAQEVPSEFMYGGNIESLRWWRRLRPGGHRGG